MPPVESEKLTVFDDRGGQAQARKRLLCLAEQFRSLASVTLIRNKKEKAITLIRTS
jgi:hypothetical protein